ncbi:hypothetical protein SAY87_014495 [Trapa incisa]|uniref:Uncharacterized protein n=1 Tax=Trapa incisa TaxID=236973 RepID=A0AAN7JKE5_9MYRT|nr:hypothetical protein SAY87_014495 [Trapa incisa]
MINSIPPSEYGYGNRQSTPMNVIRIPLTGQALSVPCQSPNLFQRSSPNITHVIQNSSSTVSLNLHHFQHQLPVTLQTPPSSICQSATTPLVQQHPVGPPTASTELYWIQEPAFAESSEQ